MLKNLAPSVFEDYYWPLGPWKKNRKIEWTITPTHKLTGGLTVEGETIGPPVETEVQIVLGAWEWAVDIKKMNLMKNKKEYNHKPKIKTVLRIYLWLDYHSGLTVLNYLNPSFLKLDPSLKLFFAHFISFLESVIWLPTAISGPSSREQPYSRNVNHCIVTTFHPKVTDR